MTMSVNQWLVVIGSTGKGSVRLASYWTDGWAVLELQPWMQSQNVVDDVYVSTSKHPTQTQLSYTLSYVFETYTVV